MASLLRLIQHNSGDDAGISLQTFCDDVGGPVNLKTDRASCFEGRAPTSSKGFTGTESHYLMKKLADIMSCRKLILRSRN